MNHGRQPAPVILITGLPRCGSSWVGQVLSAAPGIRYRYESLNTHWVPRLKSRLGHFRYQRPGTPGPPHLRDAVDWSVQGHQSARQWLRAVYRGYFKAAARRNGRLVLKDPTACLLAGWLEAGSDCQVALLVRHPCGFASSVDALGWPFHLSRLLSQKALVEDHLSPWVGLLEQSAKDHWAALGGFWAATHHVLNAQANRSRVIVRYENLCFDPHSGFRELAEALGLPPPEAGGQERTRDAHHNHRSDPGSTRKDSQRMPYVWRERMSTEAIDSVMEVVERMDLREFAEAGLPQESL